MRKDKKYRSNLTLTILSKTLEILNKAQLIEGTGTLVQTTLIEMLDG